MVIMPMPNPDELSTTHAACARQLIDAIATRANEPGGIDLTFDQIAAIVQGHALLAIHAQLVQLTAALDDWRRGP